MSFCLFASLICSFDSNQSKCWLPSNFLNSNPNSNLFSLHNSRILIRIFYLKLISRNQNVNSSQDKYTSIFLSLFFLKLIMSGLAFRLPLVCINFKYNILWISWFTPSAAFQLPSCFLHPQDWGSSVSGSIFQALSKVHQLFPYFITKIVFRLWEMFMGSRNSVLERKW